jgi:hypothetical protein
VKSDTAAGIRLNKSFTGQRRMASNTSFSGRRGRSKIFKDHDLKDDVRFGL